MQNRWSHPITCDKNGSDGRDEDDTIFPRPAPDAQIAVASELSSGDPSQILRSSKRPAANPEAGEFVLAKNAPIPQATGVDSVVDRDPNAVPSHQAL